MGCEPWVSAMFDCALVNEQMVALRIELSVTAVSEPSGHQSSTTATSWALGNGTEPPAGTGAIPACNRLHSRYAFIGALACCESERSELNRRSLGPQPSAIPDFATL